MPPRRTLIGPFAGGLNSLVDPLVGNMMESPDAADHLGQTGLYEQRFGFDILDLEPSHINDSGGTTKTRRTRTEGRSWPS